jgi:hypothetical protein
LGPLCENPGKRENSSALKSDKRRACQMYGYKLEDHQQVFPLPLQTPDFSMTLRPPLLASLL